LCKIKAPVVQERSFDAICNGDNPVVKVKVASEILAFRHQNVGETLCNNTETKQNYPKPQFLDLISTQRICQRPRHKVLEKKMVTQMEYLQNTTIEGREK